MAKNEQLSYNQIPEGYVAWEYNPESQEARLVLVPKESPHDQDTYIPVEAINKIIQPNATIIQEGTLYWVEGMSGDMYLGYKAADIQIGGTVIQPNNSHLYEKRQ